MLIHNSHFNPFSYPQPLASSLNHIQDGLPFSVGNATAFPLDILSFKYIFHCFSTTTTTTTKTLNYETNLDILLSPFLRMFMATSKE